MNTAHFARVLVARSGGAALAWWILSEGRADAWLVGAVAVALAVAASLWLAPPRSASPVQPGAALAFAGYFLVQSLRAGAQVAWIALTPHLRLAPRAVTLELALPAGPARYVLVSALSLLPGTLSVSLDGARLVVHALTAVACVEDDVRNLETRIARMFGVTA